jgi:hypothetical protein
MLRRNHDLSTLRQRYRLSRSRPRRGHRPAVRSGQLLQRGALELELLGGDTIGLAVHSDIGHLAQPTRDLHVRRAAGIHPE